jgi:hypothetical protein
MECYAATWKMMCGEQVYPEFQHVERLCDRHVITDSITTRLWIVILFFSTPLHYHHDSPSPTPLFKKRAPVQDAQSAYTTLLWKYLVHRHDQMEAVRIFSDLVRVYLKMQRVGYAIYSRLRSLGELQTAHETLQKLVSLDINDQCGEREVFDVVV